MKKTSDLPQTAPHKIEPKLYQIPLLPPIAGFQSFFSAWLHTGSPSFLLDPGPSVTIPQVADALDGIGITHLDYILLTHIHLDHAGGVAELASQFSKTPVICHPGAVPHLVDPSRLWEGTLKTLGAIGKAYGSVQALSPERITGADVFRSGKIQAIDTPGHAPHHTAYLFEGKLFAGEAAGVFLKLSSGSVYLRPATPPKFFLETSLHSIDRLIASKPAMLCYGHHGVCGNAPEMLLRHRQQLLEWNRLIADCKETMQEATVDGIVDRLLREDPFLAAFEELDPDVRKRERFFLGNSVKGFLLR